MDVGPAQRDMTVPIEPPVNVGSLSRGFQFSEVVRTSASAFAAPPSRFAPADDAASAGQPVVTIRRLKNAIEIAQIVRSRQRGIADPVRA